MPDTRLRRCVEIAAPLTVCAVMFLPDERMRWLAIGIITAVAFSVAVATEMLRAPYSILIGVAALRWVPLRDVIVWREIVVLIGVAMVFIALDDDSPLAVAATLAVALVTPAMPPRGLLFPFIVAFLMLVPLPFRLGIAIACVAGLPLARYSFGPMLVVTAIALVLPFIGRVPLIPQTAAVALLCLWPWSGLIARSLPPLLRATAQPDHQQVVGTALDASQSVSVDVPPGTRTVIVTASGADAQRLWPNALLGQIEVTDRSGRHIVRDIHVADAPDFGFMRREHFFSSHNSPPREPVADIRGFGASAWLYGAGRIRVDAPGGITSLRVRGGGWHPGAKLQVETIGE